DVVRRRNAGLLLVVSVPLPGLRLPLVPGEAGLQRLKPGRLPVPLGGGGVAPRPALPPASRDGEPCLNPADPRPQAGLLGAQVPLRQIPLVLAGAGDRPGTP